MWRFLRKSDGCGRQHYEADHRSWLPYSGEKVKEKVGWKSEVPWTTNAGEWWPMVERYAFSARSRISLLGLSGTISVYCSLY